MFSTEIENKVVVVGISAKGPASRAELKAGDVILAVNGEKVTSQTGSIESSGGSGQPASMCH